MQIIEKKTILKEYEPTLKINALKLKAGDNILY